MKKGPHKMMLESSRYEKWDRGGGGGGGGGAPNASWPGRERDRERERERQARAHQMAQAHAAEPDAASLFPAPVRVKGNSDYTSQQIQRQLGDYHLAQAFLDDPSKSIGICAEPPSPAPCLPSRRESEFKKPSHAPQNGRVHHRPLYSKSDAPGSAGAPHRPPHLRIPNGVQPQNVTDSIQPPIESILKEMKFLPTPLSCIAATPRKELDNKFIFNPYTNKVQENPQQGGNDLKTPLPKPGLDNRIANPRRSVSPDVVVPKEVPLSESDDEAAAAATRLPSILSPLGSGGSSSSDSESSRSDSESESSSTESSTAPAPPPAAPAPAPQPAQRLSWSLLNFAQPPAQPPEQSYEAGKELAHALADVKGKPSPISELSDSEASSPSSGSARRRRSIAKQQSSASSDDERPRTNQNTPSPRVQALAPTAPKRGRPPKPRVEERPAKKKRGRPPKVRPASPPAPPPSPPPSPSESEAEPEPPPPPPPPQPQPLLDTKNQIFKRVFTPRKGDEGGGKGGKGGKGKGGKGKGQVTIIAPESLDDDERRRRDRSDERRRNDEAIAARLSPQPESDSARRRDRASHNRIQERRSAERTDRPTSEKSQERVERPTDRPSTERTSNDRIPATDRIPGERLTADRIPGDRLTTDRIPSDRLTADRIPNDRSDRLIPDRLSSDRLTADRLSSDRLTADRLPSERISSDRLTSDRLTSDRLSSDRLTSDRLSSDRLTADRLSSDRLTSERLSSDRLSSDRLSSDRLSGDKLSIERLSVERRSADRVDRYMKAEADVGSGLVKSERGSERLSEASSNVERRSADRVDRYVKAEADVGSGLVKSERGSERLSEASSNGSERRSRQCGRVMVRVPLSRLRAETVRALHRAPAKRVAVPPARPATPPNDQGSEVAATNHERTGEGQTPIYYSYFEQQPPDPLSEEKRHHEHYLSEAKRLRTTAEREQEPLQRVMLYLESVLCFVLTGRVLEDERDTKRAFTIYRETIEYIRSIHSMPQRFRAEPHATFNKLDILSLRVQSLLYLRMFKMYNLEVKEYHKIVQEYQQKPASAESVSPLSPTPSPAGSVGSVGSGSASSGYCSLVHSVPANAHNALLQLTKYYTFLYVAHDLWEHAETLCRQPHNQDLFIAVDRKCGPLTLFSTFLHLVRYVRYAISLLKQAPRE